LALEFGFEVDCCVVRQVDNGIILVNEGVRSQKDWSFVVNWKPVLDHGCASLPLQEICITVGLLQDI
jgi:hypothetical protein